VNAGAVGSFVVKCVRIPGHMPWYTRFAAHCWFDVVPEEEDGWHRVEIIGPDSGLTAVPLSPAEAMCPNRWDRRVRVLLSGRDPAVARELLAAAADYDDRLYLAWPGPNSNTFVAEMARRVPGLQVRLPWNAVGRGYRGRSGTVRG